MIGVQLICVTVLLIFLSGSVGEIGATASTLFGFTLIITFLCFNSRLRLDFEGLFKLFESIGIGVPTHIDSEPEDASSYSPRKLPSRGLKDLPRPLARQMSRFIEAVIRDFISSWYSEIGCGEKQFIQETRTAFEYITSGVYQRMLEIDTHLVATNLINMYRRHLKVFDECRAAVNQKYPGIPPKDFEKCIVELYEARISGHIATKSQGAEMDYLRVLTDVLVFTLLPANVFSCEGGRYMVREVLAIQGLRQLVDLLTEPEFVNQAVIDILDKPVPLAIILQRWREAEAEEELEIGLKVEGDFEIVDDVNLSDKSNADAYNSEENNRDDYNEASDTNTNDSKFATPKHSSSELSSDESYDAFHRVLRQNQLEAKSSAPVYGSTTVKLHDNTAQMSFKHMMPYSHQVNESNKTLMKAETISEAADSGILSISQKPSMRSTLINREIRSNVVNEEERESCGTVNNADLNDTTKVDVSEYEAKEETKYQTPQLDPENLESWAQCPPSSADVFHRQSFHEMYHKQDKFNEQLKAKVAAARINCLHTSSCFPSGSQKLHSHKIPSIDGSATMEFPNSRENDTIDLNSNEEETKTEESALKVHSVEGRNVFYEPSPSCPTCVEMTLLASPRENGKFVPVMNRKDEKKKPVCTSAEHECGLAEAHYCNPETENEIIPNEISDDGSFVSCDENTITDLEVSVNSLASSDTLLASGESTDSSLSSLYKSKDDFDEKRPDRGSNSSLEILSLRDLDSDHSTVAELEDLDSNTSDLADDVMVIKSPSKRRTPSVTTFRSAVDSLSYGPVEPSVSAFQTPRTPSKNKRSLMYDPEYSLHGTKLKSIESPKVHSHLSPKIFKFFKERFSAVRRKRAPSSSVSSEFHHQRTSESDFGSVKDWDHHGSPMEVPLPIALTDSESCSVNSEILENSYPEPSSDAQELSFKTPHMDPILQMRANFDIFSLEGDMHNNYQGSRVYSYNSEVKNGGGEHWDDQEGFGLVEEVGSEVEEEGDVYEDAHSTFEDPLSNLTLNSELRMSKDSLSSSCSDMVQKLSPHIEQPDESEQIPGSKKNSVMIPVYKGEIIMPNPSKIPATAWLYPIQMISIPNTEVAFEKGWEPGGNKYTLYSIHYDIRIWPDIYQGQILEASMSQSQDVNNKKNNSGADSVPLIREIKRRYREFIYLHNRLTHGTMAIKMKGILRPNRRYAMPFGRMDPDVIEGRRKILEYYLVSLVSRSELCNSREFKEFLGAEGYGNVSFIKPRTVQPKMIFNKQMNRIISGIKTAFPSGSRESGEKMESSQYFIHGYDTPRMFGYGDPDSLRDNHGMVWLIDFVEKLAEEGAEESVVLFGEETDKIPFHAFSENPKTIQRSKSKELERKVSGNDKKDEEEQSTEHHFMLAREELSDKELKPNYTDDGERVDFSDRRVSGGIAALFAAQIAANRVPENMSELDAEISRKPGESPWPLSDSVLALTCQALKGYGSWITYEKVQQAVLFGLGGIIEWLICRAIDDILVEERWLKYLKDLYAVIWDVETDKLKERKNPLTEEEQKKLRDEALSMLLDIIPGIVRVSIGPTAYKQFGEGLLQSLQYKRINRHLLFAALEIVLSELIPEFQNGFERYLALSSSGNRKQGKQ